MSLQAAEVRQANKEVVQRVYDAVSSGDIEAFLAQCAEDMVLVEADSLEVGGTYRGRESVLGCIGRLAEHYDWSTLEVAELVADGDERVAARVSVKAAGPDRAVFEISEWWLVRDGKVVECRPYYLDTQRMNEVLAANTAARTEG